LFQYGNKGVIFVDDQQIIGLLFQRSETAISALQQKFGGLCRSVIARILSDRRDIEECASDTFLRIWNSIPPQRPARLDCYLVRIARNVALDRYDYNTASMRNTDLTLAYEELSQYLPSRGRETDCVEFRSFLNRFLRALPRDTRGMFLRRYWYGESIAQIASAYGYGEEKVKSSLFRTRKKLREAMIKEDIYL
jgi:RNA polymerase sigma-70 factor (ECF subfamily)